MEVIERSSGLLADLIIFCLGFAGVFLLCSVHTAGWLGILVSLWVSSPQVANLLISLFGRPYVDFVPVFRKFPTFVYVGWVVYALDDIYGKSIDAQSGISLLFVPIYSVAVLFPAWSVVFAICWMKRKN
jgi:hypothetical protein